MHEFKPGDTVIVQSKGIGAEIIETGLPNGQVKIKVAHMHVTDTRVKTYIKEITVDTSDLVPIDKKSGVIII